MLEREISNWLIAQIRQYIAVTDENAANITASFNCRKVFKGEFLLKEGQNVNSSKKINTNQTTISSSS